MIKKTIKVLLVEDDEGDAFMIGDDLEESSRYDFSLDHKTTLNDAVDALYNNEYDIVLSDLGLPDSQGANTYSVLLESTPLPIVVLTGDENDEVAIEAIEHGVQDFIVKNNLSNTDVVSAIIYAIERHKINASIQESNQLKSEFLANMSHEIRTPLNGIVGAADLLKKTKLSEDQEKYLNVVTGSSDRLLGLINDILDFSKIEAGELEISTEPLELRSFIQEVVQSITPKANEKHIELVTQYKGKVPQTVMVDSVRLGQIFINLMGNAIKFIDEGHVAIYVEEKNTEDSISHLLFTVEDTGIGIPQDKLETIFEKFAQADASTTKKYGGTGLGLAITQRLVEMMGGSIGVESEVGFGSKFYFELPLEIVQETDEVKAQQTLKAIENLKALTVDDSPVTLQFISNALSRMNIAHDKTISSKKALQLLRDAAKKGEPYDVLLTDFQMPELNGIDLAQTVRDDESIKDTNIILITALGRMELEDEGLRRKLFDSYLLKPIDMIDLRHTLYDVSVRDKEMKKRPAEEVSMQKLESKVLLVENEMVNQMIARDMLEGMGCEVDLAENGQIAVDMVFAQDAQYDAILMDCMMPVMDGFEATIEIRKREKEQGLKSRLIIAMTANAMAEEKEQCLDVGMTDYLAKPVKEEALHAKLSEYLA